MTARPPRPPSRLLRRLAHLVAASLAALAPLAAADRAGAQSDSCPTDGLLSPVDVRVVSPGRGSTVTGPTVTVRGTASTLLGELTRIEVGFGDASVARNYSPSQSIDFDLTVDASGVPAGATSVRVVACASGARGEDRFTVAYSPRAAATTTSTVRTSTTAFSSPGEGVPAATTTSVAAGAGTPGAATATGSPVTTIAGQTTIASPTTSAPEGGPAPGVAARSPERPEPIRPGINADGSVVLSDSPDQGSSRPPLWVGAVVGVSGGVGLLFSATSWRRRHQPPPLEAVDPELVEVG